MISLPKNRKSSGGYSACCRTGNSNLVIFVRTTQQHTTTADELVLLRRINQLDDEFATAMRGELATYREWENRYTQANASGAAYVTKVSIYDKLTLVPYSFAHVDH